MKSKKTIEKKLEFLKRITFSDSKTPKEIMIKRAKLLKVLYTVIGIIQILCSIVFIIGLSMIINNRIYSVSAISACIIGIIFFLIMAIICYYKQYKIKFSLKEFNSRGFYV